MTFLFISHSSQDRDLVAHFVDRLRQSGFESLFCDTDPTQGISAGRLWEKELYGALRRADGVLFLATSRSVKSRWCFAELALARSLGVLPRLLDSWPAGPAIGCRVPTLRVQLITAGHGGRSRHFLLPRAVASSVHCWSCLILM